MFLINKNGVEKMINIGYIAGKVINEINLQFVYDRKRKNISKIHTSIIELIIEVNNKNVIYARAYDEVADYVYRRIKKGDFVITHGKVRNNYFEITKILIF